jgi:hypothetical protein
MSAENLEKIVARAVEDEKFRELLFSNPAKALEGMDLTEEEISMLESLASEKFDAAARELEERISRNRLI